jgi:hypothetical protein
MLCTSPAAAIGHPTPTARIVVRRSSFVVRIFFEQLQAHCVRLARVAGRRFPR